MDTQHPNVRSHAQSRVTGKNHHRNAHPGGVEHDNTRHTTRFTVIGNHLAQHPDLSGLAIGLAVYIQSVPAGVPVDIKTLAARFPEGTTRIAAALRELETHGYLRRTRERTESGRVVTRTVSCNQPGRHAPAEPTRPPARRAAAAPQQEPPRRALPAVPRPAYPALSLLQTATEVLADLRRKDPRLLLSATDAEHLAPGVAAWLERDLPPTAVVHALTADLPPESLRRPAALLAHRLTTGLPPLPPFRAPAQPTPVPHRMINCDGCDRGFRSDGPTRCRDYRGD
ncbi:helix-turn-helix domain-containing protein [Streptomyces poonensis]|uniref:DNA-binding protein n=1 Tax=Streptomyces poonensis TaxID=68255 RepID=A0A918PKE6_9ACTN|nr:helix-turn-helix domain-containing protein [Streptomyces poonensis]GGZ12743.1 DNA-binding protein [Streptomyces poonensis]GLJ91991.1 DNA-binding protein [Streptomyces poonensis]